MEKDEGVSEDASLKSFKRIVALLPLSEEQKREEIEKFLKRRERMQATFAESSQRNMETLGELQSRRQKSREEMERALAGHVQTQAQKELGLLADIEEVQRKYGGKR